MISVVMSALAGSVSSPVTNELVDLEFVGRDVPEVRQAGIAGAEVVDRDLHARARGCARGSRSCAARSISERSVISSTSWMSSRAPQLQRVLDQVRQVVLGRPARPGTLTATDSSPQSCFHSLDWRNAVFNAQIVSFLIWPVRSAIGMKTSGDTSAARAAVPAHQRLGADRAQVGHAHLGLVEHEHLAALDRAVQLDLQVPELRQRCRPPRRRARTALRCPCSARRVQRAFSACRSRYSACVACCGHSAAPTVTATRSRRVADLRTARPAGGTASAPPVRHGPCS